MAHTALVDLVGRVLAGRYRLLAPVGAGGSGRVYLADDVRLRRRVAVKVLHSGLAEDAGFLRRFRAEAQIAAALHHPHVMAVYDWGEDEGVPFMALELLKGGSLRGLLDSGARLTPEQSAHIGRQVAAALRYAHTRGLVHRDVKPANLLFDEHGIVRVADFGLARALAEASWTEPSGTMLGTARYAAPEQAEEGRLDGRADLYALALVLVEACTGVVPVVADTAFGTIRMRATRGIQPPLELGPLAHVLARAGRPDPAERYADASDMGSALARVARQLPPPAPLPIAGLGEGLDDIDPTRIGRSRRGVSSGDSSTDDTVSESAAPLEIIGAESRHAVMRRSAIPVLVGLAIASMLIAPVALFLSTGGATAAVPSLVGLDRTTAARDATDAGLLMKIVERRTSEDPRGLVIEQRPGPGAFLTEGDEITVVVSRGPPPIALPDVAGKPVAEAQATLEQAGFVVSIAREFNEFVAKDIALGTTPVAGKKARPESTITLVVSDGPKPVPVPDVAGKTYDEAVAILASARLGAAREDVFSDTVAAGVVMGTKPAVGQPAARDSVVTIVVSKGPQMVEVPNVVGMTVEAASAALRDLGLSPDVENYSPGATVRAQAPLGGTVVKIGSKVTLFL
ncbi:MAG: PASTA domain-containing protein [Acidimicrobiia bacterium]